ncbi:MAG TPA: cation-translocating P-type ATPase [Thermoanaerobaculia bacterium]|nr:cation-translocating P-type ATPase [Thermoanaerobaculia bacterium]
MSSAPAWHALTAEETLTQLATTGQGLTSEEAARRLAQHGPNELAAAERVSPWALLFGQFKNVLVLILLGGAVLSGVLGHAVEAIAIAVIVLFAVVLGFIQEFRAERALEALKRMAAPNATVLRDGVERRLPTRELVPGDVVLLAAGDRIPADARLLEAVNLEIEEAALTGESVAVPKVTEALGDGELAVGDRKNMVFAGTTATYGRGRAVVTGTGMASEFGKIAGLLAGVEESRTSLQVALDRVGHTLARAAFAIIAVIIVASVIKARMNGEPVDLLDMLLFGIALAVAVVPEALPAVVTISLALGVQRMVKRHALVRRLPAVETLGSVSVICSDKTGTLTKDEMTVRRIVVAGQTLEVEGAGYVVAGRILAAEGDLPQEALARLLRAGALANDAKLTAAVDSEQREHLRGDPTELALVVAAAKGGVLKSDADASWPRIGEIPFTSETRRMITLHEGEDGRSFACAKGAPEAILALASHELGADGVVPLTEAARARILDDVARLAGQALRVLAVADKPGASLSDCDQGLVFLGLTGMIDPPRPEAAAAIRTCERAGIQVVMITGDHPATAEAVARELGLLATGKVVTGSQLAAMSDEQLTAEIADIRVYARVSPADKLRVVTAFQAKGRIVAMTGDGVNDAPALKKSDIGVAMGINGTDVTREAAAMTLTDDNFASIVAAVEEGRVIFGNIKKYLMYLLSSNIGELGLMVASFLVNLPLPLTAVQILYVNLATDGLPALALAVDPHDKDLMQRPPRDPRTALFTRPVVSLMLIGGLWSALVNTALFSWSIRSGSSPEDARSLVFVAIVLIEFFKAYSFRSDHLSIAVAPFANKWLNLAILWELALLALVIMLPFFHRVFGTRSLAPEELALVLGLAATVIPVLELGKWLVRRGALGKVI